MSFRWTCPYCNHKCTIGDKNFDYQTHSFGLSNKYKNKLCTRQISQNPYPIRLLPS
jgi:hypothetical protein